MSTSFPIIINSSNAINSNTYQYDFGSVVDMTNFEIALGSVSLYYSWESINGSYNNNTFGIIFPSGSTTVAYNITIPDGTYSATDLNNYLRYWFISQGLYITNNTTGDITVYAEIQENAPEYAINLVVYPLPTSLPSGYTNGGGITFPTTTSSPQFVINNGNFGNIIGFDIGTYPAVPATTTTTSVSTKTPQVSPVQSVIMMLDAAYNPYTKDSAVIHTFSSKGVQYGSLIDSSPYQLCWVPLQQGMRQQITVRFTDQSFRPLQIIDTNLVIKLHIRKKDPALN
jgi:hypothetical protein